MKPYGKSQIKPASDAPSSRRAILRKESRRNNWFRWLHALISQAIIVTSSSFAAVVVAPPVLQVVTLRAGVDADGLVKEFNLKPAFVYRRALNGFAAAVDSAAIEQLKQDPRVLTVAAGKSASIVSLNPDTDPAALVKEFNLKPAFVYGAWKPPKWWRGNQFKGFADALDAATLAKLDQDARVLAVESDGRITLLGTQVIPAGSMPPGQTMPAGILRMGLTNFPVAHINGQDHRINVDVAVLDGGIQLDHPDLNVYLPGSVSFADGSTNGSDWDGHGTFVAGVLGALDNGFGVVGVAPGVRFWSVQVIGPTQNATANLLAGLDYISQHADQISVVNASLVIQPGSTSDYNAIHQAVLSIVNQGVVFVAAAGNRAGDIAGGDLTFGNGDDSLPAGLAEVMAVSAMDPNRLQLDATNLLLTTGAPNPGFDTMWDYSNYSFVGHDPALVSSPGLAIDVAGPGVNILSTWMGGDYAIGTGTSAASPHAAGLVALYIAANGRATNAAGVYKIRQAIVDNSQPQSQWRPGGNPFDPVNNPTGDPDGNPEPLAMPSENWVPKPEILTASLTGQGFQVGFSAVPGYRYTVQYTDTLTSTNQWNDLTSTNGEGSLASVTVTDPNPSNLTRFYRLRRQAAP